MPHHNDPDAAEPRAAASFGRGWIPASRDIGLPGDQGGVPLPPIDLSDPRGGSGGHCPSAERAYRAGEGGQAAAPGGATFSSPRIACFLEHLSREGNVRAAALAAGVSAQTAYVRRRRDPAFAGLWDAALIVAREQAEQVLADRAINGVTETIWFRGEAVGERRRFDTRLLLAHLGRLDARAEAASEDLRACAAGFDDALDALLQGLDPATASGLCDPARDAALVAAVDQVEEDYCAAHPEPYDNGRNDAWAVWDAGLDALREATLTATAQEWDEACAARDARLDAALGLNDAPLECKSASGVARRAPLHSVNRVNLDADQRPCCASSRNRSAFSLMKPAASFWSYAPASSSNVTWRSEYRLSGDWRPTTHALPLYSFSRTVPFTRACE